MYRIPYYLTGHTSKGFINLLSEQTLIGIERICVLDHVSKTVKTSVLHACLESVADSEHEVLLSPDGKEYLEGVIIRDHSLAILTNTIADSANLPTKLLGKLIRIELDVHFAENEPDAAEVRLLEGVCNKAYDALLAGLRIHDDLESVYGDEMDFEKADEVAETITDLLLGKVSDRQKEPQIERRMFGTNTPDGIVNIVPEIINRTSRIHFVHGRAGTGKSTLMKRIANTCLEKGLNLELYHCSFDPQSVDMIRVPELDYAIFDATDPHAFNPDPNDSGQEVIDTYELFVNPGTDEKYADIIEGVTRRYKKKAGEGIEWLKEAGKIMERLEEPYKTEEYTSLLQEECPKIAGVLVEEEY
ncbi:hypothetical protein QR721_10205 [Aciduricibacillus chroicocephali]|uniref:Uncharacterized protein n=1 Tax=Aciduricibacillus chroicocephali TaxID=3054939 RepID=A0ABY9KWM2_9BACI|nr:hypothetical protein QR721_10205 [Bacillaceae bacterium 44XB]